MNNDNVMMDWDKVADVLYVRMEGVEESSVTTIDSEKYPGVVKIVLRESGRCVGFIIHDFSERFVADSRRSESELKKLLVQSMQLSAEQQVKIERESYLPMSA